MNHQMTDKSILNFLQAQIKEIKPAITRDIPLEDHLKDQWAMDSMELVELVARIEYQYQMIIEDESLEVMYCLKNIEQLIASHMITEQ